MQYVDALNDKNMRSTIFLSASRGRGKSCAMGLGLAAAMAKGYSNVFVTAPSVENLKTLFEFVLIGLEKLQFKENLHYEVVKGAEEATKNCVVRINFFGKHKQIIQYVKPTDSDKILYAELVVIDEAAAIPLTVVKKFIGPWPLFISSTVHGYEGTGRSLSLKLIQQLKEQNRMTAATDNFKYAGSSDKTNVLAVTKASFGSRLVKECTMSDPIRYAHNDQVEKWLYDLLCLQETSAEPIKRGMPHPKDCELFLVNKDTLFSYNKSSERFLKKLISLFVSSHYKNSPNDLQLLSDAPAHSIFCLVGPLDKVPKGELPDILCAVQMSLEGDISKAKILESNTRGMKPCGDMIPWTISEQFLDKNFPQLNGLRIVRIATHPQAVKMGYGSRSLELLQKFFDGELLGAEDPVLFYDYTTYDKEGTYVSNINENSEAKLEDEKLAPRRKLKPLLKNLSEISPPKMHYLGTSFGLTKELFGFWSKNNYKPVYVRQTANELTGEHSCIMIKKLENKELSKDLEISANWLEIFFEDFSKRFVSLLSFEFRSFDLNMCLKILDPRLTTNKTGNYDEAVVIDKEAEKDQTTITTRAKIEPFISLMDLKRLEAYGNNMIDFHMIRDLIPTLSN